jgi:hypothetical protein
MVSHFNQELLQRFLRAELTRTENLSVVRHLLTRCPRCLEVVREADRTVGLKLTGAAPVQPKLQLAGRMG